MPQNKPLRLTERERFSYYLRKTIFEMTVNGHRLGK